ncbi:MAG: hypothetical protein JW943_16205 [Deltaproteobacteria bacterium]|nr:hypothetical protein [Deltaproteobacteria bacterium]
MECGNSRLIAPDVPGRTAFLNATHGSHAIENVGTLFLHIFVLLMSSFGIFSIITVN